MAIKKPNSPSHDHINWLIESRARNQRSALLLHSLLAVHHERIKKNKHVTAQRLTAACFSLWRAAFLADKTGIRENVLKDAKEFLEKMLTDNAITYPQDRASREWTFNYYVETAKDNLLMLSKSWQEVEKTLSVKKAVTKGSTAAGRRWDRHQSALEVALHAFKKELESTKMK